MAWFSKDVPLCIAREQWPQAWPNQLHLCFLLNQLSPSHEANPYDGMIWSGKFSSHIVTLHTFNLLIPYTKFKHCIKRISQVSALWRTLGAKSTSCHPARPKVAVLAGGPYNMHYLVPTMDGWGKKAFGWNVKRGELFGPSNFQNS
jgi:hypothetical protein